MTGPPPRGPASAVGHDGPMTAVDLIAAGPCTPVAGVRHAIRVVFGSGVVLPAAELSGFRGHSVVEWADTLNERLSRGAGPMLERPTLARWESTPASGQWVPAPPLRIRGFISTATWRHALRAARELRGFGAGCVVAATRPSLLELAEADLAGVYVIGAAGGLLVRGRLNPSPPRMVATRYWEERLLAHALSAGLLPG